MTNSREDGQFHWNLPEDFSTKSAMDVYKDWLGIPDGPRPPNHYELLRCVQFEDDPDKIRGHYKKLNAHVRKYATGQYSIQSQELLNEMAKAMLCLTDANRKLDYDESLGREIPAETDELGRQPLLDILCRQGAISRDQKNEIENFASARGLSHRDAAVQMKLVSPAQAAQALAAELGYSYVELEDMLPEDDALDLVPRSLVKPHSFIPLFIDDGELLIACVDQPEHELEEELRLRSGGIPIRPVIVTPRSINQAIAQYYAPGMRDEAKIKTATTDRSKAAKPKKKKASKTAEPRKSFTELSPNEQQERKQYGILFMCWSVILPMLPQLIAFVSPMLAAKYPVPMIPNVLVMLVIAGGTIYWVTQKYWK